MLRAWAFCVSQKSLRRLISVAIRYPRYNHPCTCLGRAQEQEMGDLRPGELWEPVGDRDCRVELHLPAEELDGESAEPAAKRSRAEAGDGGEPAGAPAARSGSRCVVLLGASQLLKSASEKFRCAD